MKWNKGRRGGRRRSRKKGEKMGSVQWVDPHVNLLVYGRVRWADEKVLWRLGLNMAVWASGISVGENCLE